MNATDIQDALTLLPDDLVLATDRLRTAPKPKVIAWRRLAPIAACLVLLLSTGLVYRHMNGGAKSESVAEAPAAAAPVEMESAQDMAAAQEAPAEDNIITEEQVAAAEGHRHGVAEDAKAESGASGGWCGNTQAWVSIKGQRYTLGGSEAIALTEILQNLPYDPNGVCRCMAEFTVDTELLTGIEISLTNAFARCDLGQASLTEAQVNTIREIFAQLG